jgi:hypothetical protein
MKKFAEPTYLRFFRPLCSYCGLNIDANPDGSVGAGADMAVLACAEHKSLATRDAHAHMHKRGLVDRFDVLGDPVFEALGFVGEESWEGKAPENLTVKRSSGALETGWTFMRVYSCHDPLNLQRTTDGHWLMHAQGPGGVTKGIRVDEFTLSLPEDKHHLVAAFVERLNTIYKADAEAHNAARA